MDNNKWKEWLQNLRSGAMLPKKNHLLILFLVGMLLFVAVFPFPTSDQTGDDAGENASAAAVKVAQHWGSMRIIWRRRLRKY